MCWWKRILICIVLQILYLHCICDSNFRPIASTNFLLKEIWYLFKIQTSVRQIVEGTIRQCGLRKTQIKCPNNHCTTTRTFHSFVLYNTNIHNWNHVQYTLYTCSWDMTHEPYESPRMKMILFNLVEQELNMKCMCHKIWTWNGSILVAHFFGKSRLSEVNISRTMNAGIETAPVESSAPLSRKRA